MGLVPISLEFLIEGPKSTSKKAVPIIFLLMLSILSVYISADLEPSSFALADPSQFLKFSVMQSFGKSIPVPSESECSVVIFSVNVCKVTRIFSEHPS